MMSTLSEGSTDVYSPNVLTSNAANSIGPIKDGSAASDNQLPGCTTMYYDVLRMVEGAKSSVGCGCAVGTHHM